MKNADIIKKIAEARKLAVQEGIKANTVLINEKYAKVNSFPYLGDIFPSMICGLEAYPTDELPDGYAFAVLQTPQTARERYEVQIRNKISKDLLQELYEKIKDLAKECGVDLEEEK